MLSKSDRVLKEFTNNICNSKNNYNEHRKLCSSCDKAIKDLEEYHKKLEELRKQYHYDEKTQKIDGLCRKINDNEVDRYKQYLVAILHGYEYCASVNEESNINLFGKYKNFLCEHGIWVEVPDNEIFDCILDVRNCGIGDFDIVDNFVMGYVLDNECQIPLDVIDDNEFIGNIYNFLKGLKK